MESNLSCLSSLKEDDNPVYVQPHYKEAYRLAIYALLCGGKDAYEEFLRAEQISHFLSEEEILFILEHVELPTLDDDSEGRQVTNEGRPSTYFPIESDDEVPNLDLGWPGVRVEDTDTSISLLFHPPRQNSPTIKEVIRKQIQQARQLIAIAMDVFTDVDIFKDIINAVLRGVVVYILLDESQFKSFHTMSHKVGVNIQDLKNMCVRTVEGQQYQCQSGMKFHGGLEQKFILVDCRTVVYGTYSYTWSYEKINLSMVLVVTGQLVSSYDEEFRRLYARSVVPEALSIQQPVHYLRNTVGLQRPSSSQLSLHQIHMRSRVMHGMRTAQDDRFNNAAMMTRGVSVQEKLHQTHCPDMGNLVRGHSYGGELQKLNSMTRLRMGTKDIRIPVPPDRTGSNMRGGGDRLSKQHLQHRTRYGADQNMIPFNSETSLHRWKIDAYLEENDMTGDASCDSVSPMISPYSSHTGLNEYQSHIIHSRSRDIRSRMEDMRQKRLSLQDYVNLRQSQESLRSMYSTPERPKYVSLRGLDMRQSVADLEPNAYNGPSLASHKDPAAEVKLRDTGPNKESDRQDQTPTDGHHSAPNANIPLSRTSADDLDVKLNDPSLKLSHLHASSLSIQHPRAMESLTEVPEEKEISHTRVNSSDSAALNATNEEIIKHKKTVPKENSVKSSLPAESRHRDQDRGGQGSNGSLGSAAPRESKKSVSSNSENVNTCQDAVETMSSPPEKQREEPTLQRKNSMRQKVQSMLSSDEKKASKKEEKSLQRKASIRSQNPSGSNLNPKADSSQVSVNGLSSGWQNSTSSAADTEKHKSPFPRLSSSRSSKRKTNPAEEQDQRSAVDSEGMAVSQTMIDKAYSRYEYLLSSERSVTLKRHDSDKKLGRFMQRMGNLIGKNKQN